MIPWLKSDDREEYLQESAEAESLPDDSVVDRNRYMLESLEPRILLSADPILGELARWVHEDPAAEEQQHIAVIFQELDQPSGSPLVRHR